MKRFEIGYNTSFEIRRETYLSPANFSGTILFLSDLHFTSRSKRTCIQLITTIKELAPSIILLGGDYADTKGGLKLLEELLVAIGGCPHIYAIAGNHDFWFERRIKNLMQRAGIKWIEGSSTCFDYSGKTVFINGGTHSGIEPKADFSILCMHKPTPIQTIGYPYHLMFAGHLHGSQVVLWQNHKGLYPGRLFYRFNTLKYKVGNCICYISKGLGDTLPIRFNCKKDIIFITIIPEQKSLQL